jgi:hypothetical protein
MSGFAGNSRPGPPNRAASGRPLVRIVLRTPGDDKGLCTQNPGARQNSCTHGIWMAG